MAQIDLDGMVALVTRPAIFATSLCDLIEAHNGQVVRFPVLEFAQPVDPELLSNTLKQLSNFDWAVFVSIPAVQSVVNELHRLQLIWPQQTAIAVVGLGSANACQVAGLAVSLMPSVEQNSEGLIRAFAGHKLAMQKIIIFQGQSGRQLLDEFFTKCGALTSKLQCYRRQVTVIDAKPVEAMLRNNDIDAIIITSQSTLDGLLQLIADDQHRQLFQIPFITASKRIANYCRSISSSIGVKAHIEIARSAANDDIVAALGKLFSRAS